MTKQEYNMKKFIILIFSIFFYFSVKAVTPVEAAELYQQNVFKPYILKVIPNSYIAYEGEYNNSYIITYSYNPFLGNEWVIKSLTPLSSIDGFNIVQHWTLNNYSGVSWCIEEYLENYKVTLYITTNPKYKEYSEGRILTEVTISPINND